MPSAEARQPDGFAIVAAKILLPLNKRTSKTAADNLNLGPLAHPSSGSTRPAGEPPAVDADLGPLLSSLARN